MKTELSHAQVLETVQLLDDRCRSEYGVRYGLVELISDTDTELAAERLQRLTGVVLKSKFAIEVEVTKSLTGAMHGWEWVGERFDKPDLQHTGEYQILVELREYLHDTASRPNTWEDFQLQADHERGLFKVLALWTEDKLRRREQKSVKDYLAQKESAEFSTMLDIADFVTISALSAALAPFIPVSGVIVSLVLIGTKYGYRKITETPYQGDKYQDISDKTF